MKKVEPDALPWKVIAEKAFGEDVFEIDDWFDAEARQHGLDFYVGYGSKAKNCQKMLFELEHPGVRITGVRVRLKVMDFTDANLSTCIKKYIQFRVHEAACEFCREDCISVRLAVVSDFYTNEGETDRSPNIPMSIVCELCP